jgi:hypothetical protein
MLNPPPILKHDRIVPFTTSQRLFVMLYKTAIGHVNGSICGVSGPSTISVPKVEGCFIDDAEQHGWRIYRVSSSLIVLEDCGQIMVTKNIQRRPTKERRGLMSRYTKFISWTHGVLLRRLGRRRVVWLMRMNGKDGKDAYWRGNINLVTGVKESWLRDRGRFRRIADGSNAEIGRETVL